MNQREREGEREREREESSFTILGILWLDEMRRIFIDDRTLRVVMANYYGRVAPVVLPQPDRYRLGCVNVCKLILRVMWKTARGPGIRKIAAEFFAYSTGEHSRTCVNVFGVRKTRS